MPPLLFLVLVVPPLDERFLLGMLPVVALGWARGWAALSPSKRRWSMAAVLVAGTAAAADLHLGALRSPELPEDPLLAGQQLRFRWSAGPSVDRRGWAPASGSPSPRVAMRTTLWQTLQQCPWRRIGGADRLLDPRGDLNWWGHQTRLAALAGDPTWSWTADGPGELWLRPAPADAWQQATDPPRGMVSLGVLRDPEGGAGIELWRQASSPDCARLQLSPRAPEE